MKQIFYPLILLLLVLPLAGTAQAYDPFPQTVHLYGFSQGTDSLQHVVRVDSVQIQNGDTITYLNRVAHRGFTLFDGWWIDQDNLFGAQVRRTPAGQIDFVRSGLDTFRLETAVPVGASWTYGGGQTVTLLSRGPASFLGVSDTVLTYQTSSGQTIRLSRSHGLLEGPEMVQLDSMNVPLGAVHLVGIEELGLGDSVPRWEDYVDFPVGSQFQYRRNEYFTMSAVTKESYRNEIITGKSVQPGTSFDYTTLRERGGVLFAPPQPDSFYFAPSPAALSYEPALPFDFSLSTASYDSTHVTSFLRVRPDGRRTLEAVNLLVLVFDPTPPGSYYTFEMFSSQDFTEELGQTRARYNDETVSDVTNLVCYNIITDSGGTCRNLTDFIVGVEEQLDVAEWVEWGPNPSQERIRVEAKREMQVEVRNALGQKIGRERVLRPFAPEVIELGHLPAGGYWLVFRTPNGQYGAQRMIHVD